MNSRLGLLFLVPLLCTPQVSARQSNSPAQPPDSKIHLDVVVAPKSGPPVSGLQRQDFTILDNNVPQTITSFEAVEGRCEPIEVVLLLDAVNSNSQNVAIAREGIDRFLRADEGRLAYPTMVAILTGTKVQFPEGFSQDGNAISTELDKRTIAFNTSRSTDSYGPAARFQISLQGMRRLVEHESGRPGRKIIIWVYPGWPVLSGPQHMLSPEQERQVFGNMVDLSTQLREFHTTLYTIDPLGAADLVVRAPNLEPYLRGVSKPNQVRPGNLALQVLAAQSGGLELKSDDDLTAQLGQCLADASAYYEISFDPIVIDRPNEYHQLEIRVARPGLTARSRQGYYSQPWRGGNIGAQFEEAGVAKDDNVDHKRRTEDVLNPHPYIDEPLAQLIERIPELKTMKPAAGQQDLPELLQQLGRSEDDFLGGVGDLIAHEYVTQEKVNAKGDIEAKKSSQDSYLILHHGNEWGANAEYRMDKKGHRLKPTGLEEGYLVTSGWALSSIAFSTAVQSQSRFRYLGEEEIGSRETYVLGFAQKPGEVTFITTATGDGGVDVAVLTQGILWVEKNSFHVIRMRTDLLAQPNETRLDQLTTEVTFFEVHLKDVSNPLWLPSDVDVYMRVDRQKFRNVHHYTNYRRYRVSVKIGDSQ